MNSKDLGELERELAQYGSLLSDGIEEARTRLDQAGPGPGPAMSAESLGGDAFGRRSSRPALAFAGLGLAAAVVLGFVVLSSISPADQTLLSAPDEAPAEVNEEAPSDESEEVMSEVEDVSSESDENDNSTGRSVSVGERSPVIVDIFSGRPNPVFDLTDAEFVKLQRTIDSLDVDPGAVVDVNEDLGFRGFVVERYGYGPEVYSLLITEDAVLLRHIVENGELDPDGSDLVLVDPGRSTYQLLRTASAAQLGELIDSIPS